MKFEITILSGIKILRTENAYIFLLTFPYQHILEWQIIYRIKIVCQGIVVTGRKSVVKTIQLSSKIKILYNAV